ncbi:DUF1223 domain-containing protein [Actomonas aquatica]|uniref:DUF1223 domain-containing protein n=1 Tax=Actomonas aquatica TaxID=2866162 RepID=A0ABZ1C7D2_9BACT|nr:DUF1223 domain-containing protein [Opitutus sp. WL0086]WRQ86220.1 DUF1223 domain-containing protein [Opitutus sp. WL0086]
MFLLLGATLATAAATAAEPSHTWRSGPDPVPLLELFTSEGCSSCPPAEAWLAGLRHDPGLWRDFVPLAWHVTYWDRLGWPDRFANPAYTKRQYSYAAAWGSGRVYTPGVVRGGTEWSWRSGRALGASAAGARGGELIAELRDGALRVAYAPLGEPDAKDLEVHVALLGGAIVSDVRRGENRGRRLQHEFVVLAWTRASLRDGRGEMTLPEVPTDLKAGRRAVAVWVSRPGEPTPLQATGGWLE